jgi:hypothetical protein
LTKFIHNRYFGKSGTKNWATFVISKKVPKVNNRSLGENSPNLVTGSIFLFVLKRTRFWMPDLKFDFLFKSWGVIMALLVSRFAV